VRIQVWPRSAGFGITASPLMTQLSELAGFKDLTIKLTGRRKNIRNAVQTFVAAMSAQSLPHDGVEGSGVYVRERVGGRDLGWGLKRGVDVP
jgi:small subunit ribosomal protein S5